MLGSYFGSTKIIQGAAGLGQGPLMAYADGVVGGSANDADMPGPLRAYSDGSLGLGDDSSMPGPLQAYADGTVGGSAANADMPGPLFAYQDGSLGDGSAPTDDPGGTPISVFEDGIFDTAPRNANFGPLQSFRDGSLGRLRGLGADALTLDLGDAATLAEVKSLLAMASGGYALTADAQKVYTPDFYTSGIWEPSASALWQYIVSNIPQMSGKSVSDSAGNQTYPNATGLGILVGFAAAPTTAGLGPDYVKTNMPHLFAWFTGGAGPVLPPYLSNADKTKGARGSSAAGMSTGKMVAWGLGAATLLGLAFVMTKKKSYRANAAVRKKPRYKPTSHAERRARNEELRAWTRKQPRLR